MTFCEQSNDILWAVEWHYVSSSLTLMSTVMPFCGQSNEYYILWAVVTFCEHCNDILWAVQWVIFCEQSNDILWEVEWHFLSTAMTFCGQCNEWYYTPAPRRGRGLYCSTSVRLSVRPSDLPSFRPSIHPSFRQSKIFFVAFFSVIVDGRNLIFDHKRHIGIPYCG